MRPAPTPCGAVVLWDLKIYALYNFNTILFNVSLSTSAMSLSAWRRPLPVALWASQIVAFPFEFQYFSTCQVNGWALGAGKLPELLICPWEFWTGR